MSGNEGSHRSLGPGWGAELWPWGLRWQCIRGRAEGIGPSNRLGNLGDSLSKRQPERTKGPVHSLAPNFNHGTKRVKATEQTKAITP